MSVLLNQYNLELKTISSEIDQEHQFLKEAVVQKYAPPKEINQTFQRYKELLSDMREVHTNMELEINSLSPNEKIEAKMNFTIQKKNLFCYEQELERLKRDFQAFQNQLLDTVVNNGINNTQDIYIQDQACLAMNRNTEELYMGKDILLNAEHLMNDIDMIADDTTAELYNQRTTIQRIGANTTGIGEQIIKARRIASNIKAVLVKKRAFLIAIIIVFVVILSFIIYHSISKSIPIMHTNTSSN